VFQSAILRGLTLAAGLWLTACASPAMAPTPASATILAPKDALTPAILRPMDMEPSAPRMNSAQWARLTRVTHQVDQVFPAPAALAPYGRRRD
jgi:hypothetical protein